VRPVEGEKVSKGGLPEMLYKGRQIRICAAIVCLAALADGARAEERARTP